MNLRELLRKPFWGPKELSIATGISISTARKRIMIIRCELESRGFINLDRSRVPTQVVIERLNIDLDFIGKHDGFDKELL